MEQSKTNQNQYTRADRAKHTHTHTRRDKVLIADEDFIFMFTGI
jgi:hypothetical protein